MKRQKRVGDYAWLILLVTIGAFICLYVDTVNKGALSNRVASLQTLGSQEGKEMVLSLTLRDGSNVKHLVKLPQLDKSSVAANAPVNKETVSSWELEKLGTASIAARVALKIAN